MSCAFEVGRAYCATSKIDRGSKRLAVVVSRDEASVNFLMIDGVAVADVEGREELGHEIAEVFSAGGSFLVSSSCEVDVVRSQIVNGLIIGRVKSCS